MVLHNSYSSKKKELCCQEKRFKGSTITWCMRFLFTADIGLPNLFVILVILLLLCSTITEGLINNITDSYGVHLCVDLGKNCSIKFVSNLSLSTLNELCEDSPPNSALNLTSDLVKKMHFDFCNIHPLFTFNNTEFHKKHFFNSNQVLNISSLLECNVVMDLHKKDEQNRNHFTQYYCILNRAGDCTLTKDANGCESCKESYKDWLCSTEFEYYLNGTRLPICQAVSAHVCLDCPALEPESSYGGYSSFSCIATDEDFSDISNTEHCASRESLKSLFPSVNSDSISSNSTC